MQYCVCSQHACKDPLCWSVRANGVKLRRFYLVFQTFDHSAYMRENIKSLVYVYRKLFSRYLQAGVKNCEYACALYVYIFIMVCRYYFYINIALSVCIMNANDTLIICVALLSNYSSKSRGGGCFDFQFHFLLHKDRKPLRH